MFPLLPAILLLLLNGPAGLDRMAHDACLPEAIKALHRQINEGGENEQKSKLLQDLQQELIIASILAGSTDQQLSKALSDLLFLVGMADAAPPPERSRNVLAESPPPSQHFAEPAGHRLLEGSCNTARSRDGPVPR